MDARGIELLDQYKRQQEEEATRGERADLAERRFELSQANSAFSQAQQNAATEARAQRAEDLAEHYRKQEELTQKQRDLQQSAQDFKSNRESKITSDAQSFLKAMPNLDIHSPTYDRDVNDLMQQYPDAIFHPYVSQRMAELTHEKQAADVLKDSLAQKAGLSSIPAGVSEAHARITGQIAENQQKYSTETDQSVKDKLVAQYKGLVAQKDALTGKYPALNSTGTSPDTQPSPLAPQDQVAIDWANANPNDPRSAKIMQLHAPTQSTTIPIAAPQIQTQQESPAVNTGENSISLPAQ